MKNISTLVDDIYAVIKGEGGWDAAVSKFFAEGLTLLAERRFNGEEDVRAKLSLSQLGNPDRKLWFKFNMPESAEPMSAELLGTFFYGDILEITVIALAMAAGHDVRCLQQKTEINGVPGSLDVVIDGWMVDVKSASSYGFQKFQKNALKEDDPFGYISQLSSYLYAERNNPNVIMKTKAAFLVVKKDRFKLVLDVYDLTEELSAKEGEVEYKKAMVEGPMPEKCYEPVPEGKSGNMKLATGCSYCDFKALCWPEMRTFLYSDGPKFLVKVVKTPQVYEVKDET